jgi:hypothetical protein
MLRNALQQFNKNCLDWGHVSCPRLTLFKIPIAKSKRLFPVLLKGVILGRNSLFEAINDMLLDMLANLIPRLPGQARRLG